MNIDMMSMSSHKIYGPKGIGAIYVRSGVNLPTYIHGGAQERKKRAGTENVPGIVGFGKAAELACQNFNTHVAHVSKLRDHFVTESSMRSLTLFSTEARITDIREMQI